MKIGNLDITAFKVGGNDCSIYLGDAKLYPTGGTDYSQQYLTFVAKESGTFKLSGNSVSYSLDSGSTWASLASNTNSPTVAAGNKILWKATLTPTSKGIGRFSSTGQFDVEGNAMSLLYGDNFQNKTSLSTKNYAFRHLFNGCATVVNAKNMSLPATTLESYCYQNMFNDCTSLTTAPVLPATELTDYCYNAMFNGCISLTTAPQLPATTLKNNCYAFIFRNCISLTTAPELSATTLVSSCYNQMFYGCTNLDNIICLATDISGSNCTLNWVYGVSASGTFTKAASMSSWTSGVSGIPNNWTVKNA